LAAFTLLATNGGTCSHTSPVHTIPLPFVLHQESASSLEGREAALVAQNLELAAQLQAVTAAHEEMRAQLSAAAAAGNNAALVLGTFGTTSSRPVSRQLGLCEEAETQLAECGMMAGGWEWLCTSECYALVMP